MTMKVKKIKNPHSNECKMCCIGNKNNLSCINRYIYVMMLIVDNIWKESLDHFCGLVIRTICYVWIHICNDIDSGQDMEKTIRTFLWFTNGIILFTFWITKNVNWDLISMLLNNTNNIVTPFIYFQQLVQSFTICAWKPNIGQIVVKSNI